MKATTDERVFGYQRKLDTCNAFIQSKWSFNTLTPLKQLIDSGFIAPMEEVRDFRSKAIDPVYHTVTDRFYSVQDAKNYFDWLVGIVSGIEDAPPQVFKKAVEQLFAFLYHMRPYTGIDKDPFASPPMLAEIVAVRAALSKMTETISQRDERIVEELGRLNDFLEKYGSLFDKMDYEAQFGDRIKGPEKKDDQ